MPRIIALMVVMLGMSLLCSCSDDDVQPADAGPDSQWTPCPKTFAEADGKACVGANHCSYGGKCSPGDSCDCKNGMWNCMRTDCSDLGPDMPLPDAKKPAPDQKVPQPDAGPSTPAWAVPAGGSGAGVQGHALAIDGAGNVLVTGHFKGQAAFGSTTLTSAAYDVFVAKVSPAGKFVWAVRAGGADGDYGYGITADGKGGAYVTGSITGMAAFGAFTVKGFTKADAFIAHLDASGKWTWATALTGPGVNVGYAVAIDKVGDVLVCGGFNDKISWGSKILSSAGKSDIFVTKVGPKGLKVHWIKGFGGASFDGCHGLAVDAGGDVLLGGHFWQSIKLGTKTYQSKGNYDVLVARLAGATGQVKWAVAGGGPKNDRVHGLAVDAKGNVHVAGTFLGSATLGNSALTGAASTYNLFVARISTAGKFTWAVAPGGSSTQFYDGVYHTIAAAPSGASLVTGAFTGAATFGKHAVTAKGMQEAFVARVNDKGAFTGLVTAPSSNATGSTVGSGLAVDKKGAAHLTGLFMGAATFGSSKLSPSGKGDLFVWKVKVP